MSGQVPVPPLRPARRRAGPGPWGGALAGPPQTPPAPWYRCLPSASATRLPAGTAKAVWCLCCFCTLPFHFVLFLRQTGTDTVTAATASRHGSLSSLTEARRGPGRPGSPAPRLPVVSLWGRVSRGPAPCRPRRPCRRGSFALPARGPLAARPLPHQPVAHGRICQAGRVAVSGGGPRAQARGAAVIPASSPAFLLPGGRLSLPLLPLVRPWLPERRGPSTRQVASG